MNVKTTIELPDSLLRRAKAAAAEQRTTLKDFIIEAVRDRLSREGSGAAKSWEKAFGGLRHLHRENRRIDPLIAAEFETIDEEKRR